MIYVMFVIGFVLLVKGADFLVDGATNVARKYNISNLTIGLTIVSFGTSMPELMVSIISNLEGSADLAIGNVLGSNISNILLVIGVSAMIRSLPLQRSTILSEIPFSLIAALLVGFLANSSLFSSDKNLTISQADGLILLFFFSLFMIYVFRTAKPEFVMDEKPTGKKEVPLIKNISMVVLGCVGLFFGGEFVVDSSLKMSETYGLSESFIGLTFVALGTSLPELATSAIAAYKKNTDLAVGNVVGSNIFNILWILGASAVLNPLPFKVISNDDILMLIASSTLLIVVLDVGRERKINRWKGLIFVLIYIGYIYLLIRRG